MNCVRRSAVVVLLMLSAACGSSTPTSPTGTSQPTAAPSPTPPPSTNFPPLSGPSRTFVFNRELSYPVHDYTKKSRFVLYDNGAFVLQYPSIGDGGYPGGYEDANGVIAFDFGSGPGGATGSVQGDLLTVRYNQNMQLSDFEDAVYALMR
jgi:hypothetical protein